MYVVGGKDGLTREALAALERSDVLCGYTVYVDLVSPLFPEKAVYTTPMTRELERCRWALETARSGRTVAMVCSGDPGVYGMAGPLLELAEDDPDIDIEVVPGVTAALSGGAVLGAPLGHDFCVISLSDLLTPWELIDTKARIPSAAGCAILAGRKSPMAFCPFPGSGTWRQTCLPPYLSAPPPRVV